MAIDMEKLEAVESADFKSGSDLYYKAEKIYPKAINIFNQWRSINGKSGVKLSHFVWFLKTIGLYIWYNKEKRFYIQWSILGRTEDLNTGIENQVQAVEKALEIIELVNHADSISVTTDNDGIDSTYNIL